MMADALPYLLLGICLYPFLAALSIVVVERFQARRAKAKRARQVTQICSRRGNYRLALRQTTVARRACYSLDEQPPPGVGDWMDWPVPEAEAHALDIETRRDDDVG